MIKSNHPWAGKTKYNLGTLTGKRRQRKRFALLLGQKVAKIKQRPCSVMDCNELTTAGGLEQTYCLKHRIQKNQYGCAESRPFTMAEIDSYKGQAEALLATTDTELALDVLWSKKQSGSNATYKDLASLKPKERVRSWWGGVRDTSIPNQDMKIVTRLVCCRLMLTDWTSPAKVEGFSDRFCESEERKWAITAAASDGFSTMRFVGKRCGFWRPVIERYGRWRMILA